MSSNGALKVWARFVRICHKVLINPYSWEKDAPALHVNEKRPRFMFLVFLAQFSIILAYEGFLLYRGFLELTSSEDPFIKKIELLFAIEAYILLNVNQWIIINNYRLYPTFIKSFLKLLYEFEAQNPAAVAADMKVLKWYLMVITTNCAVPALARAAAVLSNPKYPALLTSLLDEPQKLPKGMLLPFAYIHLHMNFFHYMAFAFNMASMLSYNFGLNAMMKALRLDPGHGVRNLNNLRISYRELSVLQITFNGMFYNFNFVAEFIALSSSVVNLFLAVIYGSPKGVVVGILSCVLIQIMYGNLARIHEVSGEVLLSWKQHKTPKWFRKFERSCRPLHVLVGRYYFADKELVLTIFSIVTNYTANLIMTFRLE